MAPVLLDTSLMFEGLIEVIWPSKCVACDRVIDPMAAFCESCDLTLEPVPSEGCRTCAEPGQFEFGQCLRCLRRPPPMRSAVAPFAHTGAMARAIHRLKYEDHPELARPLARFWGEALGRRLPVEARSIVPLPLHSSRFRARRFDQAHLLALELAKVTGRSVLPALRRVRATERQVGLSERARFENVQGAFVADERVIDEHVLLLDDVLTTGATARAASRALLDAGASSVHLVTLARAFTL